MTSVRHQCLSRPCLPGTLGKVWMVTGNPTGGKVQSFIVHYTEAQLLPQPRFGEGSGCCRDWASCPGHCSPLPATCLSLMFFFFFFFIVPILNSCPHEKPFRGQGSELKL